MLTITICNQHRWRKSETIVRIVAAYSLLVKAQRRSLAEEIAWRTRTLEIAAHPADLRHEFFGMNEEWFLSTLHVYRF
jgi:hypothetical protein